MISISLRCLVSPARMAPGLARSAPTAAMGDQSAKRGHFIRGTLNMGSSRCSYGSQAECGSASGTCRVLEGRGAVPTRLDDPRSSWLTDAVEGKAELRGRVLPRLRLRVRSRWDEARASAMRLRARSPVAVAPGGQAESAASTSSIEQAATLAPRLARAPILPPPCAPSFRRYVAGLTSRSRVKLAAPWAAIHRRCLLASA
mmetsp:Transcript_33452/g.86780  ORF Transcript_33452/g.86780 Transcript_33452/m.86780 type:complete len:201 (-) Transcript_33452:43-645(-)